MIYTDNLDSNIPICAWIPNANDYTVELINSGEYISLLPAVERALANTTKNFYKINCSFTFTSRTSLKAFLQFFENCKGSYKTFYLPCWQKDFTLTRNVIINDTVIYIKDVHLRYNLASYLTLFLFIPTSESSGDSSLNWEFGTFITRRVSNITSTATGEEEITLYTSMPISININSVKVFSKLLVARFLDSSISINWHFTKNDKILATVSCSFIEIPTEYDILFPAIS